MRREQVERRGWRSLDRRGIDLTSIERCPETNSPTAFPAYSQTHSRRNPRAASNRYRRQARPDSEIFPSAVQVTNDFDGDGPYDDRGGH
jgi:hypothetical protein